MVFGKTGRQWGSESQRHGGLQCEGRDCKKLKSAGNQSEALLEGFLFSP